MKSLINLNVKKLSITFETRYFTYLMWDFFYWISSQNVIQTLLGTIKHPDLCGKRCLYPIITSLTEFGALPSPHFVPLFFK